MESALEGKPGRAFLRVNPVQRARERDRFADVIEAADPGYGALNAHSEAAVGDAAVATEVQVPLEGLAGQVVLVDAGAEQLEA